MLHERLVFSPDVIEAQLAHSVRDSLGRAYNRTEFVDQRRAMLQAWADFLDGLRLKEVSEPLHASGARKATLQASPPRSEKVKPAAMQLAERGAPRNQAALSHPKTERSN